MPGYARLSLLGIPYNIIQRGNNRSTCFYTDEDYCRYLETLKEQADKHGCLIHAYVLMTNLVHLLLKNNGVRSCNQALLLPALLLA